MPREQWVTVQRDLIRGESWIMDGDLGPYDVPGVCLAEADTVILLDFSFWRCAWRALRAIRDHAGKADLYVLRNPHASTRFLETVATSRAQDRP